MPCPPQPKRNVMPLPVSACFSLTLMPPSGTCLSLQTSMEKVLSKKQSIIKYSPCCNLSQMSHCKHFSQQDSRGNFESYDYHDEVSSERQHHTCASADYVFGLTASSAHLSHLKYLTFLIMYFKLQLTLLSRLDCMKPLNMYGQVLSASLTI